MPTAISIEHVSKAYRLGTIGSKTLSADISRWWASARGLPDPMLKIGQEHRARRVGQVFWALEDVNVAVEQGDVVGIIGRNGAGKSTLLKILSQVTAPTSGRIAVQGRIASLLEVGTGFHPELTGRENVFLNGAILGMTREEIRRKFDEIVAFSECEEFIDTPVKRYSSGMHVRLAFAVAAHLEPELLIVDEVLAVGDAQFQRKCLGKIRDVSGHGRTVLFVSHSMAAIAALCTRAILFRDGKVALDGDVPSAVAAYQAQGATSEGAALMLRDLPRKGTGKGRFTELSVTPVDKHQQPLAIPTPGCDLVVDAMVDCVTDFNDANVAVIVYDSSGYRIIDANTALRGDFLGLRRGTSAQVRFTIADVLLKPGIYSVDLWLGRGALETMDHVESAASFSIQENVDGLKHSETFPGVYQCRFTHDIRIK